MKHLFQYTTLFVLVFVGVSGYTQTSVTGHVFAEVVESVSASSQSQTSFSIQRNNNEKIDFGQIEIKSASSASCSLILGNANLTSTSQQHIAMRTTAYSNQSMQSNAINGYQSISLQCLPDESMLLHSDSQYKGNINIVLAYN